MIFSSKPFENYLIAPNLRKFLGLKMIPFIKLET